MTDSSPSGDFQTASRRHRIALDQEEERLSDSLKLAIGLGTIALGLITAITFSWAVHLTELAAIDDFGNEAYGWVPRGWFWVTAAQFIALNGVIMILAGAAIGLVWDRPLTWARAGLGASLFTALMIIIFGVVPNQMLTLAQGPLELTSAKILLTIPPALVLGNEVSITYETIKDMAIGGYAFTNLIIVAIVMVVWQDYHRKKLEPKPTRISDYGRPIKVEH